MPIYIHLLLLIGSVLHKAKCYLKIKFSFISLSHPICSDKRCYWLRMWFYVFYIFGSIFFLPGMHSKDGSLKSENEWGPQCYWASLLALTTTWTIVWWILFILFKDCTLLSHITTVYSISHVIKFSYSKTRVRSLIRKILRRRELLPTPAFMPGKFHGQRSLVGYSTWRPPRVGHDWVTNTFKNSLSCFAKQVRSRVWGCSLSKSFFTSK